MSAAIEKRLASLEFAAKRKAPVTFVEEVRAMLEKVDGQHELDMQPGETLWDTMVRRLQPIEGWTLAGIPGDTLEAKIETVDGACQGKVSVSDEARHAARHWFEMVEGV